MTNTTDFEKIDALNKALDHIKNTFVGKDHIIDLMGVCLIGKENLFLLGPPGTAKSALVREMAKLLQGNSFEYLLTRFTEPNELFGPFDIRKLREGELKTNTEGMLPEATLIFLDELLNANSAILNSLLMVLNERIFKRGNETKKIPALMTVGASNHLPQDEALQALFDRFLVRVVCDNVEPDLLKNVLDAGWKLNKENTEALPMINANDIMHLQANIAEINLSNIITDYVELIKKLRNTGMALSDRRAVKMQRLIAASAILCKRDFAILSDFWVLRYVWDTEEQREIIANVVNGFIEKDESDATKHPNTHLRSIPDPDQLFVQIQKLKEQWNDKNIGMSDRIRIKDKLRYINGRANWISNDTQKAYVQDPINSLWEQILHYEKNEGSA